jgi:hypothetical protein
MTEQTYSFEVVPNMPLKDVFLDYIIIHRNDHIQKDLCNFFEEVPYIFVFKTTSEWIEKK